MDYCCEEIDKANGVYQKNRRTKRGKHMLVNIETNNGTLFLNMDSIDAMYFDDSDNKLYVYRKGQDDELFYYVSESKANQAIKQLTEVINNESKSNIE